MQIRTERDAVKAVKGLRTDAVLTLTLDGRAVASSEGEILFADYGVSGPAAMMIGRAAADWERRQKGRLTLHIDVLPTLNEQELMNDLRARRDRGGRTLEDLLTGLLQKRLGQTLVKAAGLVPLSRDAAELSDADCIRLARTLKGWTLNVTGSAGMNAAQVTAGGIETSEFDAKTMRSRLVPSVYAAGEVLDIDGDCGGYNLQWAWSSAYAAATAMTEELV
ncbi:MAG: aminoacetone oxidase family FAD-binding enzyme [Clostridia bacterium]|nr:aminoacetone oxidase family FAD-binding enzyme [Clostridia bacterium]